MMLLIVLGVLTVVVVAYAMGGRKWLKSKPWSAGFFAAIEPFEIVCWRKSESLLWYRFLQGMGAILTGASALGQFDLSPLWPFLPEKYRWLPPILPLIISMLGAMGENLRRYSTKPLELVEVPDVAPPHVAAAVAAAEVTKNVAVKAVALDLEEKKASGLSS